LTPDPGISCGGMGFSDIKLVIHLCCNQSVGAFTEYVVVVIAKKLSREFPSLLIFSK